MSYLPDQTVKIKIKDGQEFTGTVLYTDWGSGYWVRYTKDGKEDCDVFTAEQLDSWNSYEQLHGCVCGAEKVGSHRHSDWCNKHEKRQVWRFD